VVFGIETDFWFDTQTCKLLWFGTLTWMLLLTTTLTIQTAYLKPRWQAYHLHCKSMWAFSQKIDNNIFIIIL